MKTEAGSLRINDDKCKAKMENKGETLWQNGFSVKDFRGLPCNS